MASQIVKLGSTNTKSNCQSEKTKFLYGIHMDNGHALSMHWLYFSTMCTMYQLNLNLNVAPNVILLQSIKTKDDINFCRFLNWVVYLIPDTVKLQRQ